MKKTTTLLLLIFSFTLCTFSQEKRNCESEVSSKSVRCANVYEVYENIEVKELKGSVKSPLDIPLVIEIYKISKNESKGDPYKLTYDKTPTKIYETDENGDFCINNFSEGFYVLKFGTDDGNWNCSWIIVRVSKNSEDRRIEVELTLGI